MFKPLCRVRYRRCITILALLLVSYHISSNWNAYPLPPYEPMRSPYITAKPEDFSLSDSERLSTVVTAMWMVPGAKHSIEDYMKWMENFLRHISGNLVIYCSQEVAVRIRNSLNSTRAESADRTLIIDAYETPFDVPCIRPFSRGYKTWQWAQDPEKHLHKPELYAIWNGKNCLVQDVAAANPFGSTYFFWADMGALRDEKTTIDKWPDAAQVVKTFEKHVDHLLVGCIGDFTEKHMKTYSIDQGPLVENHIQGGFFGGSAAAIYAFHHNFWRLHNLFWDQGYYVGKDQQIMNALYLDSTLKMALIPSFQASPECGDMWFYFFQLLAAPEYRAKGCAFLPPFSYNDGSASKSFQ